MCWVTCAYNGKRGPNVCGYCMTYDIFLDAEIWPRL